MPARFLQPSFVACKEVKVNLGFNVYCYLKEMQIGELLDKILKEAMVR